MLEEFEKHNDIILTGGSGLFIDALCFGLDNIPASKETREILNDELQLKGIQYLQEELKNLDPEYFNQCDINNSRRVIRALEVIRLTGDKYSILRKHEIKPRPFECVFFVIDLEREKLYDLINRRVDSMIHNGLVEEARSVENMRNLTTLRTVGYQELFDYFDNKLKLDEAIDLIKRNSRRYAKRQLTWFQRYKNATWINFSNLQKMRDQIIEKLSESDDQCKM